VISFIKSHIAFSVSVRTHINDIDFFKEEIILLITERVFG